MFIEKNLDYTFGVGVKSALNEEHFDFVAEKLEELFGLNF
jgi:CDP-6-deoxy-D-xylo-4-hexulose-3-dehydrase